MGRYVGLDMTIGESPTKFSADLCDSLKKAWVVLRAESGKKTDDIEIDTYKVVWIVGVAQARALADDLRGCAEVLDSLADRHTEEAQCSATS